MKIFIVVILLIMAVLAGAKIGYDAAKAKYHGYIQDADARFGCRPHNQTPNGECK